MSDKLLELIKIIDKENKLKPIINKVMQMTKEKKFMRYLNYLKELFKIKNAKQMAHEIITKLHMSEPIYEISEDPDYKWRCRVRINNTEILADGYNSKKSEAKNIACEQLILSLLKTEEYGKKIRKVIKKEYNKLGIKHIQHGKEKELEVININIEKEGVDIENKLGNNCDVMTPLKEERKSGSPEKNYEQRLILDFEIFCMKWERFLIVDKQYIEINETYEMIAKCLSKDKVGSITSSTLRSNHLYIDIILQIENIEDIYNCYELLNKEDDIKNKKYGIDLQNIDVNIYHTNYNQFISIRRAGTQNDIVFNLYFFDYNSNSVKNILNHQRWLQTKKDVLSVENIILTKFLKSWKREKGLFYLKSELIEVLVMRSKRSEIGLDCMLIRLIKIFEMIVSGSLFGQMSKNIFEDEYQLDFIKDLSIKNIFELQGECVKAINNLNDEKFDELF